MKFSDILNTAVVIVIGIFVWQFFFTEHKTQVSVSFKDTTHIEAEFKVAILPIIFKNVPARIDSVQHGEVLVARASVDTIVTSTDGLNTYYDTLSVQYMFPPVNTFSLRVGIQPRMVRIDTVIIKDKEVVVDVPTKINWPIVGAAVLLGTLAGHQLAK